MAGFTILLIFKPIAWSFSQMHESINLYLILYNFIGETVRKAQQVNLSKLLVIQGPSFWIFLNLNYGGLNFCKQAVTNTISLGIVPFISCL